MRLSSGYQSESSGFRSFIQADGDARSTPLRRCATFGLTYKTVADATRMARRFNMTQQYSSKRQPYVIRAEVVW
jgi:hypothetical protein